MVMESGAEKRKRRPGYDDSDTGVGENWSCKRVEISYEEARSVLESQ